MNLYYVQHRTAQETSGSGYTPPDLPWTYDGPFHTFKEAKSHWDTMARVEEVFVENAEKRVCRYSSLFVEVLGVHPNWQEGSVVMKCSHCTSFIVLNDDGSEVDK
jgi:hypothetical protein